MVSCWNFKSLCTLTLGKALRVNSSVTSNFFHISCGRELLSEDSLAGKGLTKKAFRIKF